MKGALIVLMCGSMLTMAYGQGIDRVKVEHVWKTDGNLKLFLKNNTEDTLYLFDSYLTHDLLKNRYLRRYEINSGNFKLSYLPLSKYLHLVKEGVFFNDDRIITPFKIVWSFMSLAPGESSNLMFPKELIKKPTAPVLIDFDPKSEIEKGELEFVQSTGIKDPNRIYLEFAFFYGSDVQNLMLDKNMSIDEDRFEKSRDNYFVKSICIPLSK